MGFCRDLWGFGSENNVGVCWGVRGVGGGVGWGSAGLGIEGFFFHKILLDGVFFWGVFVGVYLGWGLGVVGSVVA